MDTKLTGPKSSLYDTANTYKDSETKTPPLKPQESPEETETSPHAHSAVIDEISTLEKIRERLSSYISAQDQDYPKSFDLVHENKENKNYCVI